MVLYVSKVFTVTLAGRVLKHVRCEKCSTEFDYELSRSAAGQGSAPYMIGQDSAQQSAAAAAQRNLQVRLEHEVELVPCPKCRWVNDAAIRIFRRTRHRGWNWLAALSGGFAMFIAAIFYFDAIDVLGRPPSLLAFPVIAILTIGALTVVGSFTLQWLFRRRLAPNATGGSVPPCTPPAILFDAVRQEHILIPSVPPPAQDSRWALFRVGQLILDPICCVCLEEASTFYRPPTTVGKFAVAPSDSIPVPMCRSCLNRVRLKWWLAAGANLIVACGIGWLLSLVHPGDRSAKEFMFWVYSFLAALAGFVFLHFHHKPYRLRAVDAIRAVYGIRFANPAYTALLARKIGEAEGHY
jgi:hypothetical protein